MDFSAADAAYRPFLPFEAWAGCQIDEERWRVHESSLAEVKKADASLLGKALEIVRRIAAIQTGAIEGLYVADRGFTFTVAAQTALMEQALGRRTDRERGLIEDQLRAYEHLLDFATRRVPIAEAWIREIHAELCKSQQTYTVATDFGPQEHELPLGQYKSMPNHVLLLGGGIQAYAPVHDTPAEMARLVRELESDAFSSAHPILQCAYAHHALAAVHPFADGNGRVARALGSVYTCRAYSLPLLILVEDRRGYFDALATADRGNSLPFVDFVLERCIEAVGLVRESLRVAQGRSVDEEAEAFASLLRREWKESDQQFDQAASNLRELFDRAWSEVASRLQTSNIALQRFEDSYDPRHGPVRAGFRRPIELRVPPMLIRLESPFPAEARSTGCFGFEVPLKNEPRSEVVIGDLVSGKEVLAAAVSELMPEPKSSLRLRVALAVEGLAAELVAHLRNEAEKSRRSKGY